MTTADDDAAERTVVTVTPNQVLAAQVKVILDQKHGRETPEWIRRLAEAGPEPDTEQ